LDYESIAFDLRSNPDVIQSILKDFDLFQIDGETFGSLSVERRLNERNDKSNKARESANKKWEKYRNSKGLDANALQTHSDSNAIKESKGNEIKGNETKSDVFVNYLGRICYKSAFDLLMDINPVYAEQRLMKGDAAKYGMEAIKKAYNERYNFSTFESDNHLIRALDHVVKNIETIKKEQEPIKSKYKLLNPSK
jgi:hypothetical protein